MKVILDYDRKEFPPILKLNIFGAPHRRQSRKDLNEYRRVLYAAWVQKVNELPIDQPIDVHVMFINPTSPDLDNCIMALYRALDGKTLKGPSILTDDGLISSITASKFYPNDPTKSENRVP